MKPRIVVVGAGIYGAKVIEAFYAKHRLGEIDLAAVADLSPDALSRVEKAYGIKGYADYREMFTRERPDAAAVVTPDHLHKEIAVAAAGMGVHLLVQKPLATSSEDAKAIIEAARANGVLLFVDFHKRFDPAHIHLKQAVAAGRLGEIEYGYVCMEDQIAVPLEWFRGWAHRSSPAWFLGVHFYDLVNWLLDDAPVRVYASGVKKKLASMGIDTYDSMQAKVEYSRGASVAFDTSWILPQSFGSIVNQHIRLVGTEGIQETDSQDRGLSLAYARDARSLVVNPFSAYTQTDPVAGEIPAGYTVESLYYFLRLVALIKSGEASVGSLAPFHPTGEQALLATATCEAIHRSALSGDIEYIDGC